MEREHEWQRELPFNEAAGVCLNGLIHAARARQYSEMQQWYDVLTTSRRYATGPRHMALYQSALVAALATIGHSYCSRLQFDRAYEVCEEAWRVLDSATGVASGQLDQARWCILRVLGMAKAQDASADLDFLVPLAAMPDALQEAGEPTLMRLRDNKTRMDSLLWASVSVASAVARSGDSKARPLIRWANRVHFYVAGTKPLSHESGYCMTDKGSQQTGIYFWQHELNKLWVCHLRGECGLLTERAVTECYEHCCGELLSTDGRHGVDYREFLKLHYRQMLAACKRRAA